MTFESPYSALDQLLHRIAFAGTAAQIALADIEDVLYRARLRDISLSRPVFVTSLPRAGTTLLLDVLAELPEFASHTYREMPFLLCPLLWNRISRAFHRASESHERIHGDGVLVSYDSPEAFEEVLWKAFFPKHYQRTFIRPWDADEGVSEFADFYRKHMRKVIALRTDARTEPGVARYLSKNNANVARVRLLSQLFPDCVLLVPIREPQSQVASLVRQHERFKAIHASDRFARVYMESIGHYEFGEALRPMNFGGWFDGVDASAVGCTDFWLQYWIHAFDHVYETRTGNVVIVSYERCCADPARAMRALVDALATRDADRLLAQASRFRPPTSYETRPLDASRDLLRRAQEVHDRLLALAPF